MTGENTVQVNPRLVRADEGESGQTVRQLLQEHRMEIYVNEQLAARLVCTAKDLENLVVGRLVTEGIITEAAQIEQLHLCESGNRARVFLKENGKLVPKQEEEPTCCTDNHVYLTREAGVETKHNPAHWKKEWIFGIANAFAQDSALHKSTGGTHSCMLAMEDRILYKAEDIGRHNALDKAVGFAVREGLDRSQCILFTTGRVPTDMVRKAAAAGIPVLVSKAVPTADAVELARRNEITLICRAWPDSFEIY
ncbi:MAG: formate dehydrogenase accessory sulfurtransferase FdhD [Lachnospiraceae bacterium]|nr:formate dehydrogenase accessory sulfurtransferase FdhD [Lachnospiraceae bacterium]